MQHKIFSTKKKIVKIINSQFHFTRRIINNMPPNINPHSTKDNFFLCAARREATSTRWKFLHFPTKSAVFHPRGMFRVWGRCRVSRSSFHPYTRTRGCLKGGGRCDWHFPRNFSRFPWFLCKFPRTCQFLYFSTDRWATL